LKQHGINKAVVSLGLTTKLTGGNGAQQNCRPVEHLVSGTLPIKYQLLFEHEM